MSLLTDRIAKAINHGIPREIPAIVSEVGVLEAGIANWQTLYREAMDIAVKNRESIEVSLEWDRKHKERIRDLEALLLCIRGYMSPGNVMPVPEQARYIVNWINEAIPESETEGK